MRLELEIFDALCETATFRINGKEADSSDFGSHYDHSPEIAEDYCCGDMRFESKLADPKVLEEYGITNDEYNEVCEQLESGLSFGYCGWCS